jgi:hypothetical protein
VSHAYLLTLTVLLLTATGCGGKLEDPSRFAFDGGGDTTAVPDCVSSTFTAKCSSSTCHGAGSTQVDLLSDGVVERLLDAKPNKSGLCKTSEWPLIATNGGKSLLVEKLKGMPCGSKMPLTGTLSTTQLTCVEDWVKSFSPSSNPDEDGGQ